MPSDIYENKTCLRNCEFLILMAWGSVISLILNQCPLTRIFYPRMLDPNPALFRGFFICISRFSSGLLTSLKNRNPRSPRLCRGHTKSPLRGNVQRLTTLHPTGIHHADQHGAGNGEELVTVAVPVKRRHAWSFSRFCSLPISSKTGDQYGQWAAVNPDACI
jgi:hypothetical protein